MCSIRYLALPFIALLVVGGAALGQSRAADELSPLPDREGFAGMFAGVTHGSLLAAGGANFPDKKPWEGGTKVWHDQVFVLEGNAAVWHTAGRLPRPLGYGVSVTYDQGVICAGGSDAEKHYADVFRLEWRDGKLTTTPLPPLPQPVANACGALVDKTLYVAGGQTTPTSLTALATVYRLDLSAKSPAWQELPPPGTGRILAVAAAHEGAFWWLGGASLRDVGEKAPQRKYLADAYRFVPDRGWEQLTDLPYPVVAAATPAPATADGVYILGGDDGTQVGVAPTEHRGFRASILRYDAAGKSWQTAGDWRLPRVTLPCVAWQGKWALLSGELRPGVRSPRATMWSPTAK